MVDDSLQSMDNSSCSSFQRGTICLLNSVSVQANIVAIRMCDGEHMGLSWWLASAFLVPLGA